LGVHPFCLPCNYDRAGLVLTMPLTKRYARLRGCYKGILSNQWIRRMSFVLQKHQRYVLDTVFAYQEKLDEIESDIRLRAMSNDTRDVELALLRRLKEECSATLYRYQNLKEAFKAVVGDTGAGTECGSQKPSTAGHSRP
jgi:hypothetical protein